MGETHPTFDHDDEHHRYARYREDLARVLPEHESGMMSAVLADPDTAMAESAVAGHVDRRAAQLLTDPDFPAWADTVTQVIGERRFLIRRLREWALLRSITTDEVWTADQVLGASDWFQREAVRIATSPTVLTLLADRGRTRRVRAAAARRIAPDRRRVAPNRGESTG
ncbi:hypothetical protein ACRS6B_20840 [Nocardia asteroides]